MAIFARRRVSFISLHLNQIHRSVEQWLLDLRAD